MGRPFTRATISGIGLGSGRPGSSATTDGEGDAAGGAAGREHASNGSAARARSLQILVMAAGTQAKVGRHPSQTRPT